MIVAYLAMMAFLIHRARHATQTAVVAADFSPAMIALASCMAFSILAGFISAVAFATILAVVSGLLIAGASSAANDLVVGLSGQQLDERMRLRISRVAAMALGALGILLGLACEGQDVPYLLALARAVGGTANFPLLLLA